MEDLRKKMKVMEKELDAAKKVNDDLVQDVRRERDLHMAAEAALANLKKESLRSPSSSGGTPPS